MRRFTFKLEPIRSLREQAQRQAQQDLAHQLAERERRAVELSNADRRVGDALSAVTSRPGTAASGRDLIAGQAFVERVERERSAASAGLAAQESRVSAERRRLELAARDREVLERLKQRRLVAHRNETARAEQAALGEIALTAHRRRAAQESA